MGWNYRIVRWVEAPDGTEAFGLHEAYFDAHPHAVRGGDHSG